MMSTLVLFGCLLVLFAQPATSFTVKLLGTGDSYGEGQGQVSESKWEIPNNAGDVFPDPNGNETNEETLQELNDDEMSLDTLQYQGDMSDAEVNTYLEKFGYLKPSPMGIISEEVRIEAIKGFQRFANLNPTGLLDLKTIKYMKKRRCGVVDPSPESNFANFDAKGTRKWDSKKLTYRIMNYSNKLSRQVIKETVAKAFKIWSDVSQLVFVEVTSGPSNLKLRFSPKDHGDGESFDGEGGVLAHAYYPKHGEIHMDDAENWTVKTKGGTNLLFVLVHEIGHALGLGHSKISDATMGPFYDGYDPNFKLHPDDIAGIQFLYGKPVTATTQAPTTKPPTTQAPTTRAPTTEAPTTKAPTTQAPTTKAPTTQAPTTKAPTTQAPITQSQTTQAPTTQSPNSQAPTTRSPTTQAPTTRSPTTQASSAEVTTTESLTTKTPTTVGSTPSAPVSTTTTTENPQTNYPTTEDPYDPMPPNRKFPCPFRFSASMTASNRTYAFSRRWIYEILQNGKFVRKIRTRDVYKRSPFFISAAAYDEVTGHTFLFSGRFAFRYTDHQLDPGFPKRTPNFIRVAAVVNGQLVGLSFSHIHYLDEDTMEDYVDGELLIEDEYPGLSRYIRSAVSYGDGYVYLLTRRTVTLLDTFTGRMVKERCYRN